VSLSSIGIGNGSSSGSGIDIGGGRVNNSMTSLVGYHEADDKDVYMEISILADHTFKSMKTEISKNSRLLSKGGSNFHLNESEWGEPVCEFIKGLSGLSLCFNNKSRFFIKCTFLSNLKRFDRAQLYFFCVGSMSKRNQDMVHKELVNAHL
jgi:hypothetical protein